MHEIKCKSLGNNTYSAKSRARNSTKPCTIIPTQHRNVRESHATCNTKNRLRHRLLRGIPLTYELAQTRARKQTQHPAQFKSKQKPKRKFMHSVTTAAPNMRRTLQTLHDCTANSCTTTAHDATWAQRNTCNVRSKCNEKRIETNTRARKRALQHALTHAKHPPAGAN